MTQKVLFMKGLPGSGKSTYAKELVDKEGYKRVNKDELRAMLDNGKHSKQNEKEINDLEDQIIISLLSHGHSVIVDNTHIFGNHIERITWLIRASGYSDVNISTHFMSTPLPVCVARDLARPATTSVGKKVIRKMYEAIKDLYIAEYVPNPDLPNCLIVDIDGTLAHMTDRSPYDYTKVSTDTVDETVRDIVGKYRQVQFLGEPTTYVVIVSGRLDTCRADTEKWLADNNIPYDELHMRSPKDVDDNGSQLDDTIVKKNIFNKWIKNRYNVYFVLDDRDRVVNMWRSLGLKVLQVGEGDF